MIREVKSVLELAIKCLIYVPSKKFLTENVQFWIGEITPFDNFENSIFGTPSHPNLVAQSDKFTINVEIMAPSVYHNGGLLKLVSQPTQGVQISQNAGEITPLDRNVRTCRAFNPLVTRYQVFGQNFQYFGILVHS